MRNARDLCPYDELFVVCRIGTWIRNKLQWHALIIELRPRSKVDGPAAYLIDCSRKVQHPNNSPLRVVRDEPMQKMSYPSSRLYFVRGSNWYSCRVFGAVKYSPFLLSRFLFLSNESVTLLYDCYSSSVSLDSCR